MATARILQFGEDNCHRSTVLEGAGYSVEKCHSITEFGRQLRSLPSLDAVVITEQGEGATLEAIEVAKSGSSLPVILFANADDAYADSKFDLVIPVLTSPTNWLAKIAETIERSRVLRDESQRLRNQAIQLRSESAEVRWKSEMERARSRIEYSKNRTMLKVDTNRLDPDGER
jgi:hypothetical protein